MLQQLNSLRSESEEARKQNHELVLKLSAENSTLRDQLLHALKTITDTQSEVVSLKLSFGESQEKSIQLMNELSVERVLRNRLEYDAKRDGDQRSSRNERSKRAERELEYLKLKYSESETKAKSVILAKDAEIKSKSETIASLMVDINVINDALSSRQRELEAVKREAAEAHKLCASQSAMIEEYIMLISIHAMSS